MTSTPMAKNSLAIARVSPKPPAAFSPFATTNSIPSRSRKFGSSAPTTSRPGRPMTSPMNSIRMASSEFPHAVLGHHQVERAVMTLAWKLFHFLARIGNSGGDGLAVLEGVVIIAAAITEAMTGRIECKQGNKNERRFQPHTRMFRLGDPVPVQTRRRSKPPFGKIELTPEPDDRKREPASHRRQRLHQRQWIRFVLKRMVTGDHRPRGRREFRSKPRDANGKIGNVAREHRPVRLCALSQPVLHGKTSGRDRIRRWRWILTGLQVQVGAICPRPRPRSGTAPGEYH